MYMHKVRVSLEKEQQTQIYNELFETGRSDRIEK
jgi:hypothetical protein